MNNQEILRRVTQNDLLFKTLALVDTNSESSEFYSDNSDDYSTLGVAIANNTHLERLIVILSDDLPLTVTNSGFYDGLKQNTSIRELNLWCNRQNIAGGVGQEMLKVYRENNNQLTNLHIESAGLQNGGDRVVTDTLRCCRNLRKVTLNYCHINDEQLLPIVDALRGHLLLETLDLFENYIGNVGCDAIVTLLADPNCNIRSLHLGRNSINNEGATAIANSLTNYTKLQDLSLHNNPIDRSVQDVFSNVLCNTSNINNTYSSNHTLNMATLGGQAAGQHFASLLRLNDGTNKSHVAIRKILNYHSNIDMEPFFEWDAEGDQTLKALPYVVTWFERAGVAVADDNDEEYNIEERKLSSVFQFAKTMPILFEGMSYQSRQQKTKEKRLRLLMWHAALVKILPFVGGSMFFCVPTCVSSRIK